MGTEKHLHIVQAVKILMGDYLQATLRQTIHLIAIMDDVAKAIKGAGAVKFGFGLANGSDHSKAESGIRIYFYEHGCWAVR